MAKPVEPAIELISETDQYILDTAQLVTASAAENRTLHVSQSFSGTRLTTAVVVCFVTHVPTPRSRGGGNHSRQSMPRSTGFWTRMGLSHSPFSDRLT